MIKTALNTTAPFFAGAIGGSTGSSLLGLQPGTLGTGLLILMALAVIANQLWTLFDKARRAIRSPEADTANRATVELCDQRHHEIEKALEQIREKALGMSSSSELSETSTVLFQQLINLFQ